MSIEIGARAAENAAKIAAKEAPKVAQGLWGRVTSALGFGKDEAAIATTALTHRPLPLGEKALKGREVAWLHSLVERYRLIEAPELLAHLPQLTQVVGEDAIKQAAQRAGRDRGLFQIELVALAERGGYKDLAGLQQAIPDKHICMAGCPFCQPLKGFRPANGLVGASERFSVGPTITPLFTTAENGGHFMVFPQHHRSVMGALPEQFRQEFIALTDATRLAMEKQYGKPVSVISNGLPGYGYDPHSPFDTHAHVQLFSGDADITKAVAGFFSWSKTDLANKAHPIGGWNDYFQLYEQGALRQRYVLTMDGTGQGHVLVIGNQRTGSGFARRMVGQSMKLARDLERVPSVVDEPAAKRMADELRGKIVKQVRGR